MALAKKSKIRDPSYGVKIRGNRKHIAPITLSYRLGQTGQIASGTSTTGNQYIDLAQGLSIVGRKLYRQGKCYYISSISLVQHNGGASAAQTGTVEIATLPNTWWVSNAWVKSFAAWSQMRKQVLEETPSLKARWADYKVFLNKEMSDHTLTGADHALPQISTYGTYTEFEYVSGGSTVGEWDYAKFTQPDHAVGGTANDYYGHMLGPNNGTTWSNMNSAGLVLAYEISRARVQPKEETGSPGTGMYSNLFDLGGQEEDLTDDIIKEGELPPYNMLEMQNITGDGNGNGTPSSLLTVNMSMPIASGAGFPVPLGLLQIRYNMTDDDYPLQLMITMTPGKYHGVHAETMGQ